MIFSSKNVLPTLITCFLILIGTSLTVQNALAQDNEPLTDEMRNLLKSEPFNIGILLQSTANFSLSDDNFNGANRFGLGATRLKVSGAVDGGFNYNLQMDFRRASSVVDAAIGYKASKGFALKAGLQKPDIGLDLQPNPGATDFISRARLIGTMLNTRELGVSASGVLDNFDYTLSVFNGTGYSLNNDDRFMVAAKGAFTVDLENDGSLYIGANGALNGTENESVGFLTSQSDRLIYGAFLDYESNNWFGAAEVLMTSFETVQTQEDETITGAYVTIGNNVTDKDQLLARFDHISYKEIDNSSNLFVFGWNHQATSVISLQLNAMAQFDENEEYFGLSGNFQYQF